MELETDLQCLDRYEEWHDLQSTVFSARSCITGHIRPRHTHLSSLLRVIPTNAKLPIVAAIRMLHYDKLPSGVQKCYGVYI